MEVWIRSTAGNDCLSLTAFDWDVICRGRSGWAVGGDCDFVGMLIDWCHGCFQDEQVVYRSYSRVEWVLCAMMARWFSNSIGGITNCQSVVFSSNARLLTRDS